MALAYEEAFWQVHRPLNASTVVADDAKDIDKQVLTDAEYEATLDTK